MYDIMRCLCSGFFLQDLCVTVKFYGIMQTPNIQTESYLLLTF